MNLIKKKLCLYRSFFNMNKLQHDIICKTLGLDNEDVKDMYNFGIVTLNTDTFDIEIKKIGDEYFFIVTKANLSRNADYEIFYKLAYILKKDEINLMKDELTSKYWPKNPYNRRKK